MTLTGINLFPSDRHMALRKRYRAIVIGKDYFIHRKTYKRLCKLSRRGKDLRPLLSRIMVEKRIPDLGDWFKLDLNPGPFS